MNLSHENRWVKNLICCFRKEAMDVRLTECPANGVTTQSYHCGLRRRCSQLPLGECTHGAMFQKPSNNMEFDKINCRPLPLQRKREYELNDIFIEFHGRTKPGRYCLLENKYAYAKQHLRAGHISIVVEKLYLQPVVQGEIDLYTTEFNCAQLN